MKGAQRGPTEDHMTQEQHRFTNVAALALPPKQVTSVLMGRGSCFLHLLGGKLPLNGQGPYPPKTGPFQPL